MLEDKNFVIFWKNFLFASGPKAGAGENTLRRLALFLYKDHPPKCDVTSGKKAG